MGQQNIRPISHSTGSHIAHTTGGAVTGAIKGGAKSVLWGIAILAVVGAGLGLISAFGGWAALGSIFAGGGAAAGASTMTAAGAAASIEATAAATAAAEASAAFAGKIASGLLFGGLLGGLVGVLATPITGGFGMIFGGAKGAERGHEKVQNERAMAHVVDAQLGAYQAQAIAMQAAAQQGRPGDRYAGASTMIQTDGAPQIDAATAAQQGMINGAQLQAGR